MKQFISDVVSRAEEGIDFNNIILRQHISEVTPQPKWGKHGKIN